MQRHGDPDVEASVRLADYLLENREQMFFESMHCLFFDDRQQTTCITKDDRRRPPPSSWQQQEEKERQRKSKRKRRRELPSPKRKNQQAHN
jgi:hypothetical protein